MVSLATIGFNNNINILTVTRFINVVIGIVLALIINNHVFPYNIDQAMEDLKQKYDRIIKLIKDELSKYESDSFNEEKLIKSILLCNDIENKLIANNKRVQDDSLEKFLFEKNSILSDIRYLILHKRYYK